MLCVKSALQKGISIHHTHMHTHTPFMVSGVKGLRLSTYIMFNNPRYRRARNRLVIYHVLVCILICKVSDQRQAGFNYLETRCKTGYYEVKLSSLRR